MARGRSARGVAAGILEDEEASLLDVVDNALSKGVVLNGDLMLALAQVDLVYARLSLLLSAADRVLPPPAGRSRGRLGPSRVRRR